MAKLVIYGLPHCSTCKKAVSYLEDAGAEIDKFHDIKTEPLPRGQVEKLAAMVGSADAMFSRRAIKYRTMNLKERDLSEKEMIELMTDEYTFIKRPVVVMGKRAIAGFSAKRYEELLSE